MEVELVEQEIAEQEIAAQEIADASEITDETACQTVVSTDELLPLDLSSTELSLLDMTKQDNATANEVYQHELGEKLTHGQYPVYVTSLSEAEDVLNRFQNDTKNRYSMWKGPKDFGASCKQGMVEQATVWFIEAHNLLNGLQAPFVG